MFRFNVRLVPPLAPAVVLALPLATPLWAGDLAPLEQLGKSIFFDTNLSVNANQSCASCHDPDMGFTAPQAEFNAHGGVIEGSVPGRFGNRRPPSAAYAAEAPVFHHTFEDGDVLFVGGAFLDGRATGHVAGNPGADQAMGPPLNPVEMGLPHAACVVERVCNPQFPEDYPVGLIDQWGAGICDIAFPADLAASCADADATITISDEEVAEQINAAYTAIALSVGAYEMSREVAPFSSKFDKWLHGDAALTALEMQGMEVFKGKGECAECHVLNPGAHGEPPLLTDFTYDNLGVPKNPENPVYTQPARFNPAGADFVDLGLGAYLRTDPLYDEMAPGQDGKQKVPTLRNVAKTIAQDIPRAYMHNGYFKTLEGVVKFYNKRDVWPRCASDMVTEAEALAQKCWPAPEVAANVNADELGDLKLTDAEEAALVAFLGTLSDE
ncbi:MAG: cytochrome-c peroxidase [Marinibacterium sp.]